MGRHKNAVKEPPKPPEHCVSIKEYEKSPWWRATSSRILEDKTCTCRVCGRARWKWLTRKQQWKRMLRFGVHHTTYANCPREQEGDLLPICSNCHTTCHDILRCSNISEFYGKLAAVVRRYFQYEGSETFKPW